MIDEYTNELMNSQNSLEAFERDHLVQSIHMNPNISQPVKTTLIQKANQMAMNITQKDGVERTTPGSMTQISGAVAEFSIRAVRNTSDILAPLPVVLFMSDFLSNEYRQIISNFLPPGVVLASVTTLSDRVRFAFSNGVNTDQIDLFCDTTAYPSFLLSQNTTAFKLMRMRMKLITSTANNTNTDAGRQFGLTVTPYKDTQFGAFGGNRYPLSNCEPPDQFRLNIIDLVMAKWWLTPREGLIVPIINATAVKDVLSLNMGHWVQQFTRTSAGA